MDRRTHKLVTSSACVLGAFSVCVCVYVRSRKETKGHHLGSVAKRCHYGPNEGTGQRMVKNGELPLLGTTKKAHQRTTHKKRRRKKPSTSTAHGELHMQTENACDGVSTKASNWIYAEQNYAAMNLAALLLPFSSALGYRRCPTGEGMRPSLY